MEEEESNYFRMNKKQKIHNQDDWDQFAFGYLHLAQLACEEIINSKHENKNFNMESIFMPALFNLKHGIEVLLKTLSIKFLKKEFLDKSDYSHDIDELFLKLRKDIGREKIERAIKKYKKIHPEKRRHFDEKPLFDELEELVKKYQTLDFLKEKIGTDYFIQDIENTALKYPTNGLNIYIDYEKMSKKFTLNDVLKSLIDCIKLEKIFLQFSILLEVEK